MSIRQFRPKRHMRRGISGAKKFWLNLIFISLIGLQISYPLLKGESLRWVTIATVITGGLFSFIDSLINFGARFAYILLTAVLIFSFAVEAAGQQTGWPFGNYTYSQSLGTQMFKVPLIVPLAWLMMSYPVILVARQSSHNWVFIYGGFGLMAWDLFLDPQMVSSGRWSWEFSGRSVPFQAEIPISNAFGWLLAGMGLMAILHLALPSNRRSLGASRAVPEFFLLWTWVSGIVANLFFFDRPGVAFIGGFFLGILITWYVISVRFGRND